MLATERSQPLEDIELDLLLEGIFRQYGFDFRNYARSSLKRRVRHFLQEERIETVSLLQDRILHNQSWMDRFAYGLSVNVSAMFRVPQVYTTFSQAVVPLLRPYPC